MTTNESLKSNLDPRAHHEQPDISGWQFGSVALLFKIHRGAKIAPDESLWHSTTDGLPCSELPLAGSDSPIDKLVSENGSIDEMSRRWFKNSAMRGSILSVDGLEKPSTYCRPDRLFFQQPAVAKAEAAGVHVRGVTRTRADADYEYVVLHLKLSGMALQRPNWIPAALHRFTKVDDLAGSGPPTLDGWQLQAMINFALKTAGLRAHLSWGGSINVGSKDGAYAGQIYTISTIAPHGPVPNTDRGTYERNLEPAARWAYDLATAQTPTATPLLSDLSAAGIGESLVSLGPAVAWCSERGMGIVAKAPPSGDSRLWEAEIAHASALAHSVFADLAFLVMQQDSFLDKRAKALSAVANSGSSQSTAQALGAYQQIQKQYVEFLGKLWFQEIPRKESATRVLRCMQGSRMFEERVKHMKIEQNAILSYLTTEAQAEANEAQRKELKAKEEERARAATARAKEEAAREEQQRLQDHEREEREKIGHRINWIAYIFFPISIVFTITGGTGREFGAVGIAISCLITLALVSGLFVLEYRFIRPGKFDKFLSKLNRR